MLIFWGHGTPTIGQESLLQSYNRWDCFTSRESFLPYQLRNLKHMQKPEQVLCKSVAPRS